MIKEQCDRCRLRATCTKQKIFDNMVCPDNVFDSSASGNYSDSGHDSYYDSPEPPEQYTSEYLQRTTRIHGWLTFFLIIMTIGSFISAIGILSEVNPEEYFGSHYLMASDIALACIMPIIALYSLFAFIRRKPNAVFWAKTYMVIVFIVNLFILLSGEYEESGAGSLPHLIGTSIGTVLWFIYLCVSKQVKKVIPPSFRKISGLNYFFLAIAILIPITLMGIGAVEVYRSSEEIITEEDLQYGERTDGIIILSLPEDQYEIEESFVDDVKLFDIENDLMIGTICSDYEIDRSDANIDTYWKEFEEDDVDEYYREDILADKRIFNGLTYHYKVVKYSDSEGFAYWRFIVLLDSESSKICILSCYDTGDDSYINDLLQAIRFH